MDAALSASTRCGLQGPCHALLSPVRALEGALWGHVVEGFWGAAVQREGGLNPC